MVFLLCHKLDDKVLKKKKKKEDNSTYEFNPWVSKSYFG